MKLFQCFSYYPSYKSALHLLTRPSDSFENQKKAFLDDRFGAAHVLLPIDRKDPDAFFTNWDDERLQRAWARQNGIKPAATLESILLAQIEAHGTEVFYTIDPVRLNSTFLRKLPGTVKRTIAWRAAPGDAGIFANYDLIVGNFPAILQRMAKEGCRTAEFFPGHDPVMDEYAANHERKIDVLFVGGYSRHHKHRALVLEQVARLAKDRTVVMHLDRSRLTVIAESPVGRLLNLSAHRRPKSLRAVSRPPIFGRKLYAALGAAKIVLNGAIDISGMERGNMRCFEALGCGSLLLSDAGIYPKGMLDGNTLVTYKTATEAVNRIEDLLGSHEHRLAIASRGNAMVRDVYAKEQQWAQFLTLVG
ncbi:glycosyltransferase family protein [Rhizobium leguminosarum]|uniref:glycosyltransferase family protein n=1 Tax=Rhizobium leguminosarum TaxID=384 RepID=UPI003F94D3CE